MSAQIAFKTDPQLKLRTMQKLKKEGTTLKAFLQYAMKAYVENKMSIGIMPVSDSERTPKLQEEYEKKKKDLQTGKNVVDRDDLVKKYT